MYAVPAPFTFQTWVKIKYTRVDTSSYFLEIGDWTWTGPTYNSSVSTTVTFGDYRLEFGKGAASWDDLSIGLTTIPPPIPTVSEWGLIILALLLLMAGTILFIKRRRPRAA
jgi:hypothetical protein